jgi:hypothetical protein
MLATELPRQYVTLDSIFQKWSQKKLEVVYRGTNTRAIRTNLMNCEVSEGWVLDNRGLDEEHKVQRK